MNEHCISLVEFVYLFNLSFMMRKHAWIPIRPDVGKLLKPGFKSLSYNMLACKFEGIEDPQMSNSDENQEKAISNESSH